MPEEAFIDAAELRRMEPEGDVGQNWRMAVFACS
jgi:hypothetical protein